MSHFMAKSTNWHLSPANTQISLVIYPVWSESLLSEWRKWKFLCIRQWHSKDSDQTQIRVFAWRNVRKFMQIIPQTSSETLFIYVWAISIQAHILTIWIVRHTQDCLTYSQILITDQTVWNIQVDISVPCTVVLLQCRLNVNKLRQPVCPQCLEFVHVCIATAALLFLYLYALYIASARENTVFVLLFLL